MNQIVSCPNCGQKASVPTKGPKNAISCPACHTPLETAVPTLSPKTSAFELVAWAAAVVVVLPGICFFVWLLTSHTVKQDTNAQNEPGSQTEEYVATTSPQEQATASSDQSQPGRSVAEPGPTPKSEDRRGDMFIGLMGYTKGMEWAANYGRVPSRAEYEAIVATEVARGAGDPNQALTRRLIEAYLEGFKSGCKAGLEQQRPAF